MKWINVLRNKSDKIKLVLLCLIAATIPFSVKFGNIAIILAVSFNILFFKKENFKYFKSFKSWYLPAFFLITVLSAFFSKNSSEGFRYTDLALLMLLFLVIIANTTINKSIVHKVLQTLYVSCVLSTLIVLILASIKIINQTSLEGVIFHEFTRLYDQHPVYYAMYLSLALFYVSFISSEKIRSVLKNKVVFYGSILILFIGLVLCASKAVLVLNLIAFLGFYSFKPGNKKNKLVVLLAIPVLCFFVYNVNFIKNRFDSGLKFKESIVAFEPTNDFTKKKIFDYDEKTNISDLELRYLFAKISVYHLLKDNKAYFGFGQGDTELYLNYYLFSYNLGPNWFENRNVHNQYIHVVIMYGVFVFLFFISYLLYSFRKAILKKDALHLYFLLLTCFVFIFEVVLERNKGIVFFYFFNSLFLFNTHTLENSNTRN